MSNQMKEIDWSKAPEGTTHYLPMDSGHSACWIRRNTDETLSAMYADGTDTRWGPAGHYLSKEKLLVPRPSAWTGDGLPPVGTVCEVLNNTLDRPEWERCTILFMGKFKTVYESESCHERVADVSESWMISFRPIRTPEQIAAEEREKTVQQMLKDANSWGDLPAAVCLALYKAGYRKVTP